MLRCQGIDLGKELDVAVAQRVYLLLDLVKGVAAVVKWKYALKGEVQEPGSARKSSFASAAEFSASLRKQQK